MAPFFTAPGSVDLPSLLTPAALGAPELLASPAEGAVPGMVVLWPIFEPVVPPVVLPFIEPPVVVPLAAGPPDIELPPAEPPAFCAGPWLSSKIGWMAKVRRLNGPMRSPK